MKKIIYIVFTLLVLASVIAVYILPPPADKSPADRNALNLYGVDPHTLDPALSGDATSHEYIIQIFSGLVKLDSNLEVVPDIATGWDISECGLVYTFYLNPDVYFHDGKELNAQDFKDSWERACHPDTGSQTAPLYLGDIQGASEVISGDAETINGVRVVDEHTLEVTIEEPKSYFLYKLTYPTAFAVDTQTAVGSDWWRSDINGTGPFRLASWREGSRLELERNDRYYGTVADLEKVVYHLWAGVVMELYEKGQIDVASVGVSYIDKVRDERNVFYQDLVETTKLSLMYIGFDFTTEPFDDPLVRQALARAIDKDRLIQLVFKETVKKAGGVLPPGMPGFNDNLEDISFDPRAAKELIEESRYGSVEGLPPVTITTAGYGGFVSRELQAVCYQWQEHLGLDITIRQIEPNDFYYNLEEEKDEMFYYGWVADYPHPQNFLEILFSKDSTNNTGQYYNTKFEKLIREAGQEQDLEASFELYRQAEEVLMDDVALIPLYFGMDQVLINPHVQGYEVGPLGVVPLNKVWLER